MKFKKGQLVKISDGKEYIRTIIESDESLAIVDLKDKGLRRSAYDSKHAVHLTRDEIIAHMQGNGWERISTYILAKTISNHRRSWEVWLVENYKYGNFKPEVRCPLSYFEISEHYIALQQEAHDYAQALNNAPE